MSAIEVQADWDLIRQLYITGLSPSTISVQTGVKTGTIAARASRNNWKRLAIQARLAKQQADSDPLDPSNPSSSRSGNNARKRLADIIDAALEVIEPPSNPKRALELQAKLEPLVRNAKIVHAWSDSSTEPAVRINLMATTALVQVQDKHAFTPSPTHQDATQPLLTPPKTG